MSQQSHCLSFQLPAYDLESSEQPRLGTLHLRAKPETSSWLWTSSLPAVAATLGGNQWTEDILSNKSSNNKKGRGGLHAWAVTSHTNHPLRGSQTYANKFTASPWANTKQIPTDVTFPAREAHADLLAYHSLKKFEMWLVGDRSSTPLNSLGQRDIQFILGSPSSALPGTSRGCTQSARVRLVA